MPGRISEEKKTKLKKAPTLRSARRLHTSPERADSVGESRHEIVVKEIVDEKKILKEAEEREKERKEEEKKEKEEQKRLAEKSSSTKVAEDRGKAVKKIQGRVRPRHGKKYRKIAEQIEKDKEYPVAEAIELALKTSPAKFDATIELHIRINSKEKNIRGMVNLSGGVVKEKKILEVSEKNVDDIVEKVKGGKIDFDIMIAELKLMPKLTILAKILGPKGLMPSPKAGTAVEDVAKAVEELRSGKTEYRADKNNIVHIAIGKISFGAERVYQNYEAILKALPIKKIESIYLTTSMGPSIKVAKK